MRRILPVLALLLASPSYAQSVQEPFHFKGLRLGATLDEMRLNPPRDERVARARLICTGDVRLGSIGYYDVQVNEDEAAVGIRRCVYISPPISPIFSDTQTALNVGGGEHFTSNHLFEFAPATTSGPPILYRIVLDARVEALRDVLPALRARFGEPSSTQTERVQNSFGAVSERMTTRWERPSASLSVIAPSGRRDRMRVVYVLTDVATRADAMIEQRRAGTPNRM